MSIPSLRAYCRPQTVADVVGLLGRYGEGGLIVAGATFVHGLEARGLLIGVSAHRYQGNRAVWSRAGTARLATRCHPEFRDAGAVADGGPGGCEGGNGSGK